MASYSVTRAKHAAAMVASTVDTVTFTTNNIGVEVRHGGDSTSPIYFTTDGTTPTVAGDNTYVVFSGESLVVPATSGTYTLKLISAGVPTYHATVVVDL